MVEIATVSHAVPDAIPIDHLAGTITLVTIDVGFAHVATAHHNVANDQWWIDRKLGKLLARRLAGNRDDNLNSTDRFPNERALLAARRRHRHDASEIGSGNQGDGQCLGGTIGCEGFSGRHHRSQEFDRLNRHRSAGHEYAFERRQRCPAAAAIFADFRPERGRPKGTLNSQIVQNSGDVIGAYRQWSSWIHRWKNTSHAERHSKETKHRKQRTILFCGSKAKLLRKYLQLFFHHLIGEDHSFWHASRP